jgi:hypothetical protein
LLQNILWWQREEQNINSHHLGFEQTINIPVEKARRSHRRVRILFAPEEADANKVPVLKKIFGDPRKTEQHGIVMDKF